MEVSEYRVVPHTSGSENQFEFVLLDPAGRIVSRSWSQSVLEYRREEYQAIFDAGRESALNQLRKSTT